MNVDQFSAILFGGAGISARRLHESLGPTGVKSRFWYGLDDPHNPASDDSYHRLKWRGEGRNWLERGAAKLGGRIRKMKQKVDYAWSLRGRPEGLEHFSTPWRPVPTPWDAAACGSDVVHLHWVAAMIDYPSFFASLPEGMPVVWTLNDINAFTGGCHYAGSCEAYTKQCGHCPQIGRPGLNDIAARAFRVKAEALADVNLHVVAPSRWLSGEARRSQLLGGARSIRHIPHGIDTEAFVAIDKQQARQRLGLPPDGLVIGFGAESLTNRRKGFGLLLEALRRLPGRENVRGLAFGGGDLPKLEGLPEIHRAGYVATPAEQSLVYSAADLYALPSLEENLAQTGLEALACGTPVVAFQVGGIPDYVLPEKTGLLARVGDVDDLARQIGHLLANPEQRLAMGRAGRQLIETQFSAADIAYRHKDLYEELVHEARHAATANAA